MKAGRRDKRIQIEGFAKAEDDYGQSIKSWTLFHEVWAEVWIGSGSERRQLAVERGQQSATFRILESPKAREITLAMRVQYAGSAWDIEGIAPETPRRGEMEITAVREQ